MTIPILHHNFDATGIDLTYTYWTLGIIIVAILVFCLFIPRIYEILPPRTATAGGEFVKLFAFCFSALMIPMFLLFILPHLFSSDVDGKPLMRPVVEPRRGHDTTLFTEHKEDFAEALDSNEQMREYDIPECELNNTESIICGGTHLVPVEAIKGGQQVSLMPHVDFDSDNSELKTDNPDDKGVNTYFWVEEKESEN